MEYQRPEKIEEILAADREDTVRLVGRFDPERAPKLHIRHFPDVKKLQVAVSPDCSYRLVREAISQAKNSLRLYIYNISAKHLIALIAEARDRGVNVRIMFDDTASSGDEKSVLDSLGVSIKTAPSSGNRGVFSICHQKFAVIDDQSLLLGSANWVNTAIPQSTIPGEFKKGNREWLVLVEDAPVASWFAELFDADWNIPEQNAAAVAGALVSEEVGDVMVPARRVGAPHKVFDIASFDIPAGIGVTPLISPDNYFDAVLEAIQSAKVSIDIEQQYIKEGGPKTAALLAAVAEKVRGGTLVRIIVSPAYRKLGETDSWEASVATLQKYGLRGCLRAMNINYFTHLHNKGVLIDRNKVVVSSTNWSENSIARAREAGLLIANSAVADYFAQVIDLDWALSWDVDDVPENLMRAFQATRFVPGGLQAVHPADFA